MNKLESVGSVCPLRNLSFYLLTNLLGPTIAEDVELFKSTQNSLLKELRREKEKDFTSIDREKLDTKIGGVEREYENLKKKR